MGWKNKSTTESTKETTIVILFIVLFLVILIRSAWVSDDAYITLRTVDNLYQGHGLTWNAGERVQTYTHPLWMFIISAVFFLSENPYYLLVSLSIFVSAATILWLVTKTSLSTSDSIIGILLLSSSKAFIDYSTSGLENPLTHLLYIVFIYLFLKTRTKNNPLLLLSLTASLSMLNRLDTILLYFPAFLFVLWRNHTKRDISYLILGFLPIIVWELFSIFYYGFPFPNTAYAKLNTSINGILLAKQGILYLINSLSRDPISLSIIFFGIIISFTERDRRKIMLALGSILYIVYIIKIGGDFMSGRFFSVLVLGAVALIIHTNIINKNFNHFYFLIALALFMIATPEPPIMYNAEAAKQFEGEKNISNGIEDERRWYHPQTGLITVTRDSILPRTIWAAEGKEAKENGPSIVSRGAVGMFGFFAGSSVHVVDADGLGDPLLARLPAKNKIDWRIGHFLRKAPEGYIETHETNQNQIHDPNLAEYYDKLSIIIKGSLFDSNRILEIWKMNTGYYQPLLDAYISSNNLE